VELTPTRFGVIVGLWTAAFVSSVWYAKVLVQETAKRKAIAVWLEKELESVELERKACGLFPSS
jgi:hypothetical protein